MITLIINLDHSEVDGDHQHFIPSEDLFRLWINSVLETINYHIADDGASLVVNIDIVNPTTSAQINHQWRNQCKPTNVLAFEQQPDIHLPIIPLGDLVFCNEVIIQEAQANHKKIENHWAHLTIHGMLHLLGFDHIEADEAEIMESLEIDIMKKLGLANPYHFENE